MKKTVKKNYVKDCKELEKEGARKSNRLCKIVKSLKKIGAKKYHEEKIVKKCEESERRKKREKVCGERSREKGI